MVFQTKQTCGAINRFNTRPVLFLSSFSPHFVSLTSKETPKSNKDIRNISYSTEIHIVRLNVARAHTKVTKGFPVNGWAVFSFLNKIKWAKTQVVGGLKDKTFGMIVCRNFTPEALRIARENKIRFLSLSNIKIDYKDIREQATKKITG